MEETPQCNILIWHVCDMLKPPFFLCLFITEEPNCFFLIWKKEKDTAYSFEKLLELILDSNQTNRDSRLFYLGKKHV